jgi:dinuclear metal center YbgI/SA1388 family protein
MKTSEFLSWAESVWPISASEDWDNPGLISGSLDSEHSKVLVTVDITNEVLQEALDSHCTLVIAHHPLLLGGIDSLRQDLYKGALLAKAIKNDVSLFAAHTNADVVSGGVSDSLAKKFGIENTTALDGNPEGHGRVGKITPQKLSKFLETIKKALPETARGISFIGNPEMQVQTVAVVAGSGMSFVNEVSADVFITSDIKHHPALDFKQQSNSEKALVEISHYSAESIWLEGVSKQLLASGLEVVISKTNTDPWDGVFR